MELEQLNIKTVFLHGILEEDILMQQFEGFKVEGKENYVCRLKRSLYGLKKSPSQCYKRFDEFIISYRYNKNPFDSCVYHSKVEDGSHIHLITNQPSSKSSLEQNQIEWSTSKQFTNKHVCTGLPQSHT